jgi:HK97 family phage portal protein
MFHILSRADTYANDVTFRRYSGMLLNSLMTRLRRRAKTGVPGAWRISSWQEGREYYPQTDLGGLVKKYVGWVYACAHLNAVNCAQAVLRLYVAESDRIRGKLLFPSRAVSDGAKAYLRWQGIPATLKAEQIRELTAHPLLSLLQRPNKWTNQFDLIELTFLNLELTGNAFWNLTLGPLGEVMEIWPLAPEYTRIVPSKSRFIDRYEYQAPGGEKEIVHVDKMVHFRYPNPQDLYYGMGPLAAAVLAADLSAGMNVYENALMINRAQPDMALVFPAGTAAPPENELERVYKQWPQRFRGLEKAGKMIVLTGGVELKPVSLTPKEMAFLQGRRATKEEIAAVFGVPMSKLTSEDVNRANADAGDYQYAKNTLRPKLTKLQEAINSKLIPLFDDSGVMFCAFDNPVPADKDYELRQREANLRTGYSTINEERTAAGLPTVSWGSVPYLPITLAPIGSPIAPGKYMTRSAKARRRFPPLNHPTNFVDKEFEDALADYFDHQKATIIEAMASTCGKALASGEDWLGGWFDMTAFNAELSETMTPFVRRTLLAGGERALAQFVLDRPFDPIAGPVMNIMESHRQGAVVGINATKLGQLRQSLGEGIAAGEALVGLRRRVESLYEGVSRNDASRIARTETIWAFNEGAVQGYKQTGIITKKIWVSSGDDRSCEFCLSMDGKVIDVDAEYFSKGDIYEIGGRRLHFDYEGIGHPPIHPHCRCAIAPEVELI